MSRWKALHRCAKIMVMTDAAQSDDKAYSDPLHLLDWQLAAGADLAVGEQPIDRFALSTAPATPAAKTVAPAAASSAPPTPMAETNKAESAKEASDIAASANTLEELEHALNAFEGCALRLRATQLVFSDGNPKSEIMFIGEAPGRDEDLQGKPFVGQSGQLLDKMLLSIGLDRTKVYMANTVPWRPPGNRTPTPAEISACLPFLHRQIALVNPKILIAVGAPAAQTLFDTTQSISRLRGKWFDLDVGDAQRKGMAILHPAYLLRQPAQKRHAWHDLLALKKALDAL